MPRCAQSVPNRMDKHCSQEREKYRESSRVAALAFLLACQACLGLALLLRRSARNWDVEHRYWFWPLSLKETPLGLLNREGGLGKLFPELGLVLPPGIAT